MLSQNQNSTQDSIQKSMINLLGEVAHAYYNDPNKEAVGMFMRDILHENNFAVVSLDLLRDVMSLGIFIDALLQECGHRITDDDNYGEILEELYNGDVMFAVWAHLRSFDDLPKV